MRTEGGVRRWLNEDGVSVANSKTEEEPWQSEW